MMNMLAKKAVATGTVMAMNPPGAARLAEAGVALGGVTMNGLRWGFLDSGGFAFESGQATREAGEGQSVGTGGRSAGESVQDLSARGWGKMTIVEIAGIVAE
jgi:hypothetical protein